MVFSFFQGSVASVIPFLANLVLFANIATLLQGCGSSTTPASTPTPEPTPAPTSAVDPYIPPPGPRGSAQCFIDATWSVNEVQVMSSVVYGIARNPYTHENETLRLDIYSPPSSDLRSKRPAIVLIHGGSFVAGSKTNDYMPELAKNYAARGYVALSIDYREGGSLPDIVQELMIHSLEPVKIAQEDTKASVQYARTHAASLRIDPDRILIGGHSAGAITALYYAYVSNMSSQLEGVQGVVSISGEMKFQAFCTSVNLTTYEPSGCVLDAYPPVDFTGAMRSRSAPLLMVHGTADKIVPYFNGLEVHIQAKAMGLEHEFIEIPGADHNGAMQQVLNPGMNYSNIFF